MKNKLPMLLLLCLAAILTTAFASKPEGLWRHRGKAYHLPDITLPHEDAGNPMDCLRILPIRPGDTFEPHPLPLPAPYTLHPLGN